MNAATAFDLGPLTWVKGEIDLALQRAIEALAQYTAGGDVTPLKFCHTHVHQVYGALSIVGLDGVTQVVESVETLLRAYEEEQQPVAKAGLAAVAQALADIRQYLNDLMVGDPNQPLRLLASYEALAQARGITVTHAADLFYPDLSLRPPKRPAPAALGADEAKAALKIARNAYQKGLLKWLRSPAGSHAGLPMMRTALVSIEAQQASPATRTFWWVILAFLDTLENPDLRSDVAARYLCSRIDAQIRRLLDGSTNVAERVMREALYYIARTPAEQSPQVAAVQETFDLSALIPPAPAAAVPAPQEMALRKLRDGLAVLEESWNKFCSGSASSLASFADHARLCAVLSDEVGHTDLKRLGQGIAAVASWLTEEPGRYNDTVAMEVATAILLLQNAQEGFKRLGTDFAQQVDLMVARLYACIAGKPTAADAGIPLLDEMTRKAQEKLLISQVGREIQNNLAQIEQALDAFFRDPAKPHDLGALDAPLKQIGGALAMLGHFGAVTNLNVCGERIRQFAEADYQPLIEDFEWVANQLSQLGFFVDALQNGETDFAAFIRRLNGEDEAVGARADQDEEIVPTPTVEAQLAQQARDTRVLADALREAPQDQRLHQEIRSNLEAIQKDADLVADHRLGESAKTALKALEAGVTADAALSSLAPTGGEAPKPSAATLQLADSSHEEIDAELLAIFLEEAVEVLATLAGQLDLLRRQPDDHEALTTIRRATHTLKGSGRMVGLTDFGETAWELEQTLNLWLRQEQRSTPELLQMIGDAHTLFGDWVSHLGTGDNVVPDATALIALARRLRGASSAPAAVAPTPATPAPEPEAPAPESESPILEPPTLDLPDLNEAAPAAVESEPKPESAPEPESEPESEPEPEPTAESPAAPSPLYGIFVNEARGYLQTLIDSQAALKANPAAATTFETTRAAHTLASIAGTVNLMPLHHLARALEHALLRREHATQPNNAAAIETVQQAISTLESMFAGLALQQAPDEEPRLIALLDDIFHASPIEVIEAAPPPAAAAETAVEAPIQHTTAALPSLNDELDEQLLPIFLEEAVDQLRELTEQLRAWRGAPADDAPPHAIARLLHTFKGNARMAGALNLGEVTHQLETRVDEAMRAGEASAAMIDEIESGCDTLALAVEHLRAGPPVEEAAAPVTPVAEPAAESEPAADAPSPQPVVAEIEGEGESGDRRAMLRVPADLIDHLVNEAGELSIARARIEGEMRSLKSSLLDLTENVIRLRRQLREIEIQAEGQIQARVAQAPDGQADFDPLELDRFTRFQELTRFMAESVNDVATVQQGLLKNLDDTNAAILAQARLNRSLQQELMGLRMLPFASQVERFYRIVRQTAKAVGKRAHLDVIGGQVEIDRSVLDKMLGPIEHMLRNAVTHGLESREERLAAGKNETGEITLKLAQEGNEIILSLTDDGRGLDMPRIRQRAEETGLLTPGQAIEPAALFDLVFRPGFSTATELSQVAGRGVGMDVVKTEVTALGGRIEITTESGKGTTFRLYLPLTLAVTQTVLVRTGPQIYAIPSTMIEQVLELKDKQLAAIQEKGEAEWQGHHYPLHFLSHLLGVVDAQPEVHRRYWVLLLRSGSQRVAVQIDELQGNQEVVVKNIGAQLARVVGIAGATVLGDGRVVLILNPVALAGRGTVAQFVPAQPAVAETVEVRHRLPTVMVVDDSLTVRKITSRLLTREGYQVMLAKDGVDALEQLVDDLPDVILSDIEMPRMDGFDFVRNVRADERLRDLPIIMITSRTADKHRNYAFEIGANHYLGKPYDENELLALVAGYCKKAH
ncbi:MAG: Hpt domain-containing protein [Azonexus sp.]|jgi:chemosensory pili system protein ChpA (sensor histidine kinase/response regulator)|nr:Hpt domain-containing protein [Azonexus sp.]